MTAPRRSLLLAGLFVSALIVVAIAASWGKAPLPRIW